ncbi:DNA cytosine methyltransferase [Corallococcus sp. AS-1-6]|uniref:DNA cytosine methyltransferase n=1 Tax=Corallococcus sp. AS-1-6 TaxID=2874599 RepID=UPI001CBA6DFD|nr:DNA cytosine methyltransferase [Corallococcus sp. AS-1-6]MBZ4373285.1 DNA cytosine methyltransferase [Corallococcus sp. AS-1-6]
MSCITTTPRIFTIGYPFCGSGIGASGSDAAIAQVLGASATFRNLGGIDFDAEACADFEMLTGARALCADVTKLTPHALRAFWGPRSPDVLKGSAPCKAGSGLLPLEVANTPAYQAMNELMVVFSELFFEAYPDPETWPALAVWENVPSLLSAKRAARAVDRMLKTWTSRGYLFDVRVHDLGKEGGLPQKRRRLAIIFRNPKRCPVPVELPPEKPLRSVGDALGPLPWPDDPRAGPMHRSPRLSWANLVRLALIGIDWKDGRVPKWDWRDLPPRGQVVPWLRARGLWSVDVDASAVAKLEELLVGAPSQKRNEVHRRQPVQPWGEASPTVTGPGGAGLCGVQDARLGDIAMRTDNPGRHVSKYAVQPWTEASRTVTGAQQVGSGGPCAADPRILEAIAEKRAGRPGFMQVGLWDAPSATVTARTEATAGQSMGAVADPRLLEGLAEGRTGDNAARWKGRPGYRQVVPFDDASPTISARTTATSGQGPGSVADDRLLEHLGLGCECRNGFYGVLPWDRPSGTVTGSLQVDCGTAAVADPRGLPPERPVISLELALHLLAIGWEVPKGCLAPAILAPDGTWHRPLTTLELARLQTLPMTLNGRPLVLAGRSDRRWREHIGNGIPRDAAEAWGRQLLESLLRSSLGEGWRLCGNGQWVAPELHEGYAA